MESVLCQQLGVSRSSVREALRVLSAERLVVYVPNRGLYVASIDWSEAEQIYQARAVLEGEVAALAAQHRTDSDIKRIRRSLEEFDRAVLQGDVWSRLTTTSEFYMAIGEAGGNKVLVDLIDGLQARINSLRAKTMMAPGRPSRSYRELREILDAICIGDHASARAAAVKHIIAAQEVARSLFDGSSDT